jgi:hypothetical protein
MNCKKCSFENLGNAKFCSGCGSVIPNEILNQESNPLIEDDIKAKEDDIKAKEDVTISNNNLPNEKTKKNKKVIIPIVILLIVLTLYATNPTKEDFKDYANNTIASEIQNAGVTANTFIDSLISIISGNIAEKAADIMYSRNNYYLFSIYQVQGIDFDYKYLGIFRLFMPINDFIDVKKINISFRDERAVIDESFSIEEDYYTYYNIPIEGPTEVKISGQVLSGPQIDMYLIRSTELTSWENIINGTESNLSYFTELSQSGGNSIEKASTLDKGTYVLILDNTDVGDTMPSLNFQNDISNIDIKVTLKELY